ncbi:hypothetical protein AB0L22_32515 [Micromonospora haikouensis]|uniref:hypothetical protein n=1 Tax=Micromonospora haikouensis TaxID=686309 RepID=UPI003428E4C9
MTQAFWDRVTGARVDRLPAHPLLGRYQLTETGRVNGHDAAAHTPVVPTGSGRWSAGVAGRLGEGTFARDALPDPALAARTAAVVAALATASQQAVPGPPAGSPPSQETEHERWIAVPPLATDLIAQLRAVPDDDPVELLEQAMDADLSRLEAVCQRPEARLRPEASVVPLARARRMAQDAVTYLAAHTEDWQRRSIGGVFPRRLRAIHNEPDPNLYENQVAVQLVDHLIAFVEWRRQRLEATSSVLTDLDELAGQLQSRPWRSSHRLATLIGEFADRVDLNEDVQRLLRRTREHRRRLDRLRTTRLYRDRQVTRRARFSADLRQTNMFVHHQDYRRVAALWRAWARASRTAGLDSSVAPGVFCTGYDQFVALLVARALDALGYVATTPHAPITGGPDLHYEGPGDDILVLRIGNDGVVELSRDGHALLVVVPLPHPLTADGSAGTLHAFVDDLDRARPHTGPPRVVVYPGTRAELKELPPRLRARADSVGNDLPGGPGIGLLPATPTEIDGVERMTRALQWARVASDAAGYPPRIRCPADLLGELTATGSGWLRVADERHLAMDRPPTPAELSTVDNRVAAWRGRRVSPGRRKEHQASADALTAGLHTARALLDRLAHCPVCGLRLGDPRGLHARAGTFTATCRNCRSEWGTRSCGHCGTDYPVIETTSQRSAQGHPVATSGLGNELLAVPCWQATATGTYICPNCGRCGGWGGRPGRDCHRCADPDERN